MRRRPRPVRRRHWRLEILLGAESGLDGLLREKAIVEELATLKGAGTWKMTDIPERADIVGSKRMFWATKDPAASLVCCEDRLVAPFNIFAPDTRLSSIRAVLAIAAAQDYCIRQIDVDGAYLNEIHTVTPPGLSIPNPFGRVFAHNPHETFYGLKQSERRWQQWLVVVIMGDFAFRGDGADQVVPFRREKGKDDHCARGSSTHCQVTATGFKARMVRISRSVPVSAPLLKTIKKFARSRITKQLAPQRRSKFASTPPPHHEVTPILCKHTPPRP